MQDLEFIAPCHFGLEAVLKREITDLGYEIVSVEDGRIIFRGDQTALAKANIFIRTAERIMIKVGSFKAVTFDELFEGTKALSWDAYLPKDAKFWVTKATRKRLWTNYREFIIPAGLRKPVPSIRFGYLF